MPVRSAVALLVVSLAAAATAAAAGEGAQPEPSLLARYVGTHRLRVNRVSGEWAGTVTITQQDASLRLSGNIRNGPHFLELSGTVEPVSPRRFHLDGEIHGAPDMAWAKEQLRERRTKGRFTFEATGGRRYWRLYQVDGRDCVCDANCGNDFCYIDIEFLKPAPRR